MDISDVRRNALALALVLTAANIVASSMLMVEAHKLRRQAEVQCEHVSARAMPIPPASSPKVEPST